MRRLGMPRQPVRAALAPLQRSPGVGRAEVARLQRSPGVGRAEVARRTHDQDVNLL
jgi:hypothetical protein